MEGEKRKTGEEKEVTRMVGRDRDRRAFQQ